MKIKFQEAEKCNPSSYMSPQEYDQGTQGGEDSSCTLSLVFHSSLAHLASLPKGSGSRLFTRHTDQIASLKNHQEEEKLGKQPAEPRVVGAATVLLAVG